MKFNNLTQSTVEKSSENGEVKEFDHQSVIIYPSDGDRKVEHTITLLEGDDFDLSPLVPNPNGKGEIPNPDCNIMVVHSLPKRVDGHSTVLGNKRLIPFTATRPSEHLAIGQRSAYYDKINECILADAMDVWKKEADKLKKSGASRQDVNKVLKYRRSNMVYIKCYLWESKITENGETKVEPVNKVVVCGFDVKDLFWKDKTAFGNKLIENSNVVDGDEIIDLFKENKFIWTSNDLKQKPTKAQLTSKEQTMIDSLRQEVKEGKYDETFAKLYPIKYNDFVEMVDKGEVKIELPEVKNKGVSIKDLPKEVQDSVKEELDDDTPPF